MIQETSKEAYKSITETLGTRQIEVLRIIRKHPEGINNLEISKELERPINTITPRTNELKRGGYIEGKEMKRDKTTGRITIQWKIKTQ